MEKNHFMAQILCRIVSIRPLDTPIEQTRIINGVETATKRLPFTFVMGIKPDLDGAELTSAQAAIVRDRTRLYLTAHEMESMRLALQAPDFMTVCGLVSFAPDHDPCVAVMEYAEYITGDEYLSRDGSKFSYQPTADYPIGSVRHRTELARDFFTPSASLKRELFQAHLAAQTRNIGERSAEERSAFAMQQADMKRQKEQARATKQAEMNARLGLTPPVPPVPPTDPPADQPPT